MDGSREQRPTLLHSTGGDAPARSPHHIHYVAFGLKNSIVILKVIWPDEQKQRPQQCEDRQDQDELPWHD